jgi:hypothetical protein
MKVYIVYGREDRGEGLYPIGAFTNLQRAQKCLEREDEINNLGFDDKYYGGDMAFRSRY